MDTKTTKQPEIKDGKLIINGDSIDLNALEELLQLADLSTFSNSIENLFYNLCQVASIHSMLAKEMNDLDAAGCFPEIKDIYYLKQLSDSFKKMQR